MAQTISSQLLKGFLQGILLAILKREPNYGYGIAQEMNRIGLGQVPKGTIYPLLATMEKRGLIQGESRPSEGGPDRKYYLPTADGLDAMNDFFGQWQELEQTMQLMIDGAKHEGWRFNWT